MSTKTGQRIKELREERGLSQGALERQADLGAGYISRIESGGRKRPGDEVLGRIAEALGVSLEELAHPSPPRRIVVSDDEPYPARAEAIEVLRDKGASPATIRILLSRHKSDGGALGLADWLAEAKQIEREVRSFSLEPASEGEPDPIFTRAKRR